MFHELHSLHERPEPFSRYSAETLWTDPHISQRMLEHHLDAKSDLASRQHESIDRFVDWMNARSNFAGKAVCDLGCGPGLYSARMARHGANVTGIDFSKRSIDYARNTAQMERLAINYIQADYLKGDLPSDQDVVCLIYGDLCALSSKQRRLLYSKAKASLKPNGWFAFDVFSTAQYEKREEASIYARRLMNGFWAEGDYFGFLNTFLYEDLKLALDRYLIVEPTRTREIFNWLQYFDPTGILEELTAEGFKVVDIVDALTGEPLQTAPREFVVIAQV